MNLTDVLVAILLVVFVPILHGFALLGSGILEPIATSWPSFNSFYNRHPWSLCIAAGLLLGLAWIVRANPTLAIPIAALGAASALADIVGMLLSFLAYVQKEQR